MKLFFWNKSRLKLSFLVSAGALMISCQQQAANGRAATPQDSIPALVEEQQPLVAKSGSHNFSLADFMHLYPVEIVKPGSTDVYEKYGIELSGICYACDLAEIRIRPEAIDLINVCDDKAISRLSGFKYIIDEDKLIAEKGDQVLIFTKIEAAAVYTLEIKAKSFSFENKRIVKYYVPKKMIGKFEQHDCGDFQG